MSINTYFIGIDVGTGSARAGIFDNEGRMIGHAHHPIQIWTPEPDFAEQSTEDIWQACRTAVRQLVRESGVPPHHVRGIGIDATCSLAVVDKYGRPVTVSESGDDHRNVIVWMDHRATEDAAVINATKHDVLRFVGGTISPEMQAPKLRWIKRHLPETWRRAGHFFDLADYLTYRATGSLTRSLCTSVCKWTYLGHLLPEQKNEAAGWVAEFWDSIGLGDLNEEGHRRIGQHIRAMGEPAGCGLTEEASRELGLLPGTPVGVGIIDAHAGGLGALGTPSGDGLINEEMLGRRLALIGGTSSCHMAVSREPRFIGGIWGPYYSAMVPGLWLSEGGQSATGALIDHIIFSHARAAELQSQAEAEGRSVYDILNNTLEQLGSDLPFQALLTRRRHILPYFYGNRSPRADPTLRGVVTGQRLSRGIEDLAVTYLAAIQAIAYGTRHIIEELNAGGYEIDTLIATGGGTKNPVFLREHADITGCKVILPRESEAVLLGAAILGAVAAGEYASIVDAMAGMSGVGSVIEPTRGETADYHEAKYQVFHRLYEDFCNYEAIMADRVAGFSAA